MKIVSIASQRMRWPIEARGAARSRTVREALIIELRDEDGRIGLGEAAPLAGVSRDSLADAERAVAAIAARLPLRVDESADLLGLAASFTDAPAARFAIETALLAIAAVHRGCAIAELLAARREDGPPLGQLRSLRCAVVVDALDEARTAVAAGAGVLKVKVGPGLDLALIESIAALGVRLRLDANRSWSLDEARTHLAALAHLPIEYIEEPCRDSRALLPGPIALDESLADERSIDPRLAAVILKPTILGGFRACIELAVAARSAGIPAIVTHALEGPIGTAACADLALALGGDHAVGLAPHPGIAGWAIELSGIQATRIRAVDLAVRKLPTLAELVAASPVLSPRAARGPSVLTNDRAFDFGDLLASPRVPSLVAIPEIATIAAIYQALEAREPVALHHHRLAEGELERQRAQLARIPPETAVVLFTSGSTRASRGVALSRGALIAACEASNLGWRDDDRWLLALSLAHAGGLAVLVRCLVARKPVVLLDGDFDAARVARLIVDRRVTLASLVPAQLAALLADPAWHPPAHLRAVLLGGAAASPALLEAAAARSVPFLVTYGMTETFGQIATAPLERAGDPRAPLVALPDVIITGGMPDAPASLRVRAPMLATGYLDGTPIAPELVTSDLGYIVDGEVHIVGRADDVIITGGENVHPLTVEAIVAATPGVRAVCAFGVADERWGQIVAIAISVDPTFALDDAAAHWRSALPSHARPRRIAMVATLPLLATGKPDRRGAARLPTDVLR